MLVHAFASCNHGNGLDLGFGGGAVGPPLSYNVIHRWGRRRKAAVLAIAVQGCVVESQEPVLDEHHVRYQWRYKLEAGVYDRG